MFYIFSCCYNSRTIQYIKFKFEALLSYTKTTKCLKFQGVWCTVVRADVFRISLIANRYEQWSCGRDFYLCYTLVIILSTRGGKYWRLTAFVFFNPPFTWGMVSLFFWSPQRPQSNSKLPFKCSHQRQCRTQGGAKGAHAPRSDHKAYFAPRKKSQFLILWPQKRHAKKMVPVRVAHSNPTYAITECKNGRALVKHGNILPLIRYQTTPHCDARDPKRQIEPWDERRNLAPFANCKDISSWQCDWCFPSANQIFELWLSMSPKKNNTSFEANQSALFACSIRYILCGTGPLPAATICNEWIGVA